VVNLVLGYILMQTPLKHAGLTLANTISAIVQMLILLILLEQKTGGIDVSRIMKSFMKFSVSAILMSAVVLWIASFTDWERAGAAEGIISLAITVTAGGAVYFLFCYILRAEEVLFFINRIKRRLR
jgi:putative peptidoglycan lipid II flippase